MITSNMNEFARNMKSLEGKFKTNSVREFRKFVISISSSIIIGTPWDTGKARGNWQSSIDSPILSTIDRLDLSGKGVASQDVGTVSKQIMFNNMKFWLCNNLPYINRLNSGWSKKADPGYIERIVEAGNRQRSEINLLT